jgi:hypothetical protein
MPAGFDLAICRFVVAADVQYDGCLIMQTFKEKPKTQVIIRKFLNFIL